MATSNKYRIKKKTSNGTITLHPETESDIVLYDNTIGGTTVTNVKQALDTIVTAGVGVTGVKGNAETTYRTGDVNLTPANIGAAPSSHTHGNITEEGRIGTASGKVITTGTNGILQATTEGTAFNKSFETTATNIKMNGTASVGSLTTVARADHIHPTDTSRLSIKPNGTDNLITDNKVNVKYLPDIVLGQLVYGGTVTGAGVATLSTNAKTKLNTTSNTITLTNNTTATTGYVANQGIFYIVSNDGNFASLDLKVGDWLISTGSAWKKIDNTDAVTGVKGDAEQNYRIGNVNITAANVGAYTTTQADNKFVPINWENADDGEEVYIRPHSGTNVAGLSVNALDMQGPDEKQNGYYFFGRTNFYLRTEDPEDSNPVNATEITTNAAGTELTIGSKNIKFDFQEEDSGGTLQARTINIKDIAKKTSPISYDTSTHKYYFDGDADYAENADYAEQFASAKTYALTGDVTGSASSTGGFSMATTLANSGITAGTYSAVTVDAKGRATVGYQSIAVGTNVNGTPSQPPANLVEGGIFFEKLEPDT